VLIAASPVHVVEAGRGHVFGGGGLRVLPWVDQPPVAGHEPAGFAGCVGARIAPLNEIVRLIA
jgi:hypothetical protein